MDKRSIIRRTAPALVGGFLLYLPLAATAEDEAARISLKPGEWQITKSIDTGGEPRKMVTSNCLADGDALPLMVAKSCSATDRTLKDGKLTWKIDCKPKNEAAKDIEAGGSGELSGAGESFTGSTKVSLGLGEKNLVVTTNWSGKWVGECKEKAKAKAKKPKAVKAKEAPKQEPKK